MEKMESEMKTLQIENKKLTEENEKLIRENKKLKNLLNNKKSNKKWIPYEIYIKKYKKRDDVNMFI